MTIAKPIQPDTNSVNAAEEEIDPSSSSGAGVAAAPAKEPTAPPTQDIVPWHRFLDSARNQDIKERFTQEVSEILDSEAVSDQCCIGLIEPQDSITTSDLDAVFGALAAENAAHQKNVLLFLLCPGGSIEPAFQISKICKTFARERFTVVVPRQAKSAATLIAIGADEIHMGPLGQLGPIDPQLDGLPALGVSQALGTIASVVEKHPGSAEMFARYLQQTLTVEQVGYCDRISESAVQYAERLLSTKQNLAKPAGQIARELVYEYKDHNFVIDIEETRKHLGVEWIKTDTKEVRAAERIYSLFELVGFFFQFAKNRRLYIMGSLTNPAAIRIVKNLK